jgi:ribonuclease HI
LEREVEMRGMKNNTAELWVDGSCQGNPGGHSGAGIILKLPDGKIIQKSIYLGRMTSNEAEYAALEKGVKLCLEYNVARVKIKPDSELMHHQVKGLSRTKTPSLLDYQGSILGMLDTLEGWELTHVRRAHNRGADILATRAALSQSDGGREHDPEKDGAAQVAALDDALQTPAIGLPWGRLGAWPEKRPYSVLLVYDVAMKGFYVTDSDGVRILWLGNFLENKPAEQR